MSESENESQKQNEETTVSTEQETSDPTQVPEGAVEGSETDESTKLSELMSSGAAPEGQSARPDLDADALAAAQAAISEGERALAAARAQLNEKQPKKKRSSGRELALRLLLAANVLAMLVVASIPSTPSKPTGGGPVAQPEVGEPGKNQPNETQPQTPTPAGPRLGDKYNQALLASESGNYSRAVALLQEYLDESPRMPASRLVNVYRAMAHYSSAIGRFKESQDYERRAQAVTQSHSLPEDLVAMAKAAAESGDAESLRQVWARFLLQQRQVPSSLYQHVAEAYLQLGDSYRIQANEAAEQARLAELRQADELLRQQGKDPGQNR